MTTVPIDIYVRNNTVDLSIFDEVFASNTYSADLIDYTALSVIYDLGAHIGAFSRFVKERNPDARIVAVEPDLQNALCYLLNLQAYNGVMLVTARLGYVWQDVAILRNSVNSGGIAFVAVERVVASLPDGISAAAGNDYPVVTLEQLGDAPIDLIKIDIEGGEFDVLLNAPLDTLKGCHWIVGEWHGASGNFADIIERLAPYFDVRRQEPTDGDMGYFCFERNLHA